MRESELQSEILSYLRQECFKDILFCTRHNTYKPQFSKRFKASKAEIGISDIIMCYRGKYIELEVKMEKKDPSDAQLEHAYYLKSIGGDYFVVHNITELKLILEHLKKEHENVR
jgi:hypothetical protein